MKFTTEVRVGEVWHEQALALKFYMLELKNGGMDVYMLGRENSAEVPPVPVLLNRDLEA